MCAPWLIICLNQRMERQDIAGQACQRNIIWDRWLGKFQIKHISNIFAAHLHVQRSQEQNPALNKLVTTGIRRRARPSPSRSTAEEPSNAPSIEIEGFFSFYLVSCWEVVSFGVFARINTNVSFVAIFCEPKTSYLVSSLYFSEFGCDFFCVSGVELPPTSSTLDRWFDRRCPWLLMIA